MTTTGRSSPGSPRSSVATASRSASERPSAEETASGSAGGVAGETAAGSAGAATDSAAATSGDSADGGVASRGLAVSSAVPNGPAGWLAGAGSLGADADGVTEMRAARRSAKPPPRRGDDGGPPWRSGSGRFRRLRSRPGGPSGRRWPA